MTQTHPAAVKHHAENGQQVFIADHKHGHLQQRWMAVALKRQHMFCRSASFRWRCRHLVLLSVSSCSEQKWKSTQCQPSSCSPAVCGAGAGNRQRSEARGGDRPHRRARSEAGRGADAAVPQLPRVRFSIESGDVPGRARTLQKLLGRRSFAMCRARMELLQLCTLAQVCKLTRSYTPTRQVRAGGLPVPAPFRGPRQPRRHRRVIHHRRVGHGARAHGAGPRAGGLPGAQFPTLGWS